MARKKTNRPQLIIAGPGAGKTYDMVQKICEAVPSLQSHRFLAAITFTNMATDSIRRQVGDRMQVSPNIFIGTIDSFFIQFLIKPYASLLDLAGMEKVYLDIDMQELVNRSLRGRRGGDNAKNYWRTWHRDNLYKKGIVPLEMIPKLAAKIIENKRIRHAISNRLQYLFVDEFQDVDLWQYRVFDEIRKAKATTIHAVGDPEQHITGFRYRGSGIACPAYDKTPFQRFSKVATTRRRERNCRACEQLVQFTNHFHSELQQYSKRGVTGHGRLTFIDEINLDVIIPTFRRISCVLEDGGKSVTYFYLGYENALYEHHAEKYGLAPLSREDGRSRRPLEAASRLICSVFGLSERKIREECGLDQLCFKGVCLQAIRSIRSGEVVHENGLKDLLSGSIPLPLSRDGNYKRAFEFASDSFCTPCATSGRHLYSTIHKAKGLEAQAVLIVAETQNELRKWLVTDKTERAKDRIDACRLGFVAFTRAEEILCIACRERVGAEVISSLSDLGVEILSL